MKPRVRGPGTRGGTTRISCNVQHDHETGRIRWRCSCRRHGRWRVMRGPYPRVEMVRLWWKHVSEFHPMCIEREEELVDTG